MIALPLFGSSSFRFVAKGLIELHRLGQAGKDDSPEAESVRDALDDPLRVLNRTEKERAGWLSADLYSVSEPPAASPLKEMTPPDQQQLIEAIKAEQNQEWDRALELLRRLQEHISPALLSSLRGSIWGESGYPEVAAFFHEHAWQTDKANAKYHALYLDALEESDPVAAELLARQVLDDVETYDPLVVAHAARIHFHDSGVTPGWDVAQMCQRLIPILERNAMRIEGSGKDISRSVVYGMTVQTLGICYDLQGNSIAAIDCFSRGLLANPNNIGLLVYRGILRYGRGDEPLLTLSKPNDLAIPMCCPTCFWHTTA